MRYVSIRVGNCWLWFEGYDAANYQCQQQKNKKGEGRYAYKAGNGLQLTTMHSYLTPLLPVSVTMTTNEMINHSSTTLPPILPS